jgi:autotransporter-associated beta strand protein
MKTHFTIVYASAFIIAGFLASSRPAMAQTVADLGTAEGFTILGGSAVTNTGATIINGNVGVSPGTSITGFPPGMVINGAIYVNVAPATTAHDDTITAYNLLAGEPITANLSTQDLGGLTLLPGVYKFDSTAGLTGTLTLNNIGNQTGTYVFQIGTGLTTATNSAVVLLGGSDPNVFWQVGSSATLGTGTVFDGNILAFTSITLDPGASLSVGRALSINGAVTMAGGNSVNLNAPGAQPITPVNTYWNGSASNLWSGMNWSPDATGATTGPLAPGADVVFSVNPIPNVQPLNENTTLDFNALISSLTVNDPVAITISGPNTLTLLGSGATPTLTVNSGAGLTTINSDLVLGGLSQGITVNNAAGLVINGNVDGIIGLTKDGTGGLILTGTNRYTGGTTIDAGILAAGTMAGQSSTALGIGSVINHATLETTASTTPFSPAIKMNVAGDYTQTGPNGAMQLQVVTNQGPATTQAAAGVNYDTLAATGNVSIDGFLNLNFETGSSQGQRFQLASTSGPNGVTNPGAFIAATVTGTPFIPITTYNDSFGGTYAANNVVVTLFQPFGSFQGLTPNQTSVATNIDNFIMGGYANNAGNIQNTAAGTDFFNNIVTGLSLAANSNALGHALDELSPQRFEILRNVAFDNYALDMQSLDDEFARERTGQGGLDTAGFTFNDSTLGPQLSLVKSRLLAWSPAPEPGLLSDSSRVLLGGVEMTDAKDMKKMTYQAPLNTWNAFIDGGVDLGDLEHNIDESHSSYTTGRVRGGADFLASQNIRIGALFGYSHTDAKLDNEGSNAQVDSFTPGIYATYADKQGFYANGLFTYTRNDYSTDRRIVIPGVDRTANGSTGGNQFGGNLDGGYEFHKNNWTFGPSAGLTYVNLGIDNFNESGANSADLNIDNQSAESFRSRLGGTVRYQGKIGSVIITPHLSAYWQHEFLNGPTLITSQFQGLPAGTFSVQTTRGDSDNALLGFGVDTELTKNVTLFVDYQTEAGGASFFGQSASAGVKIGF